jgi:DnaJ domain
MRDPFAVMELPPIAGPEEIRTRYRELARQHHPDAGPAGSSARMAEINRAYDELRRDLAGCRRRAAAGSAPGSRRAAPRPSSRSRPAPGARTENRAAQWREWLQRARRAASDNRSSKRPATRGTSTVRVTPPILTLCRHHGFHDVKVAGEGAEHSKVLFSPARFEVVRGPFDQGSQLFRVRLKGELPESEGDAYLRVRRAGATRKVPVYEFSCPSPGGSCAFAS